MGASIVSGRDASPVFQPSEHALDEVALLVAVGIVGDAAYGGVYIASSLAWLWLVEHVMPDRWDLIGASICLVGAAIILGMPRQGV